jgi:molybdate-binding protein
VIEANERITIKPQKSLKKYLRIISLLLLAQASRMSYAYVTNAACMGAMLVNTYRRKCGMKCREHVYNNFTVIPELLPEKTLIQENSHMLTP